MPAGMRRNVYQRVEAALEDGVITQPEAERLLGWLVLDCPPVSDRTRSRRNTLLRVIDEREHELAVARHTAR
jgi:hypothetical protein